MLYNLLAKLNLWFYVKHNRETTKLTVKDEINGFLFKTPEAVLKLIRGLLSAQTIGYYHASSDENRVMVKGMCQVLQILKDGHAMALALTDKETNPEIVERRWETFKKANNLF